MAAVYTKKDFHTLEQAVHYIHIGTTVESVVENNTEQETIILPWCDKEELTPNYMEAHLRFRTDDTCE